MQTTKTQKSLPKKITTVKLTKELEAEVALTIPRDQEKAIERMARLEEVEVPATMLLVPKKPKFMSEASPGT